MISTTLNKEGMAALDKIIKHIPSNAEFGINELVIFGFPMPLVMELKKDLGNFLISEGLATERQNNNYILTDRGRIFKYLSNWDKLIKLENNEHIAYANDNWRKRHWVLIAAISFSVGYSFPLISDWIKSRNQLTPIQVQTNKDTIILKINK